MQTRILTHTQSLSAAGFAATAISYGPARMGFGLFVPEFSKAFSMSASMIGLVSGLGFLGFLGGLLVAQSLLNRCGPLVPVVSGLFAATFGTLVVATAPNLPVLAIGACLAMSSAGFAWTPFNDAVHREVRDVDRPTALAEISTGTSVGIAAAGVASLVTVLTGLSWRHCWAVFAFAGAIALMVNWTALRDVERDDSAVTGSAWREVLCKAALPIFAIAFVFGTTSAIYLSFAADHMRSAGGGAGMPAALTPGLLFVFFGLFGLAGLYTDKVKNAVGLPWLLRGLMLAAAISLALVPILPTSWVGLVLSSGFQGSHVMMTSAVLALWSERLFPALPAFSFTSALLATAAGSALGPALAGLAIDGAGPAVMFLGAATLPAATALLLRDRHAVERPVKVETGRQTG